MKEISVKIIISGIAVLVILNGFGSPVSKSESVENKEDQPSLEELWVNQPITKVEKKDIISDEKITDYFLDPREEPQRIFNNSLIGRTSFVPGEFIVKFKSDVDVVVSIAEKRVAQTAIPSIDNLNIKYNINNIQHIGKKSISKDGSHNLANVYKFTVPQESDIVSIVAEYEQDPHVLYAEPNFIIQNCSMPNDPRFDEQWALHNIGQTNGSADADIDAPEAWDLETGSSDVIIAIVDTGVDYTHSDLETNIWVNNDEIPDNGVDDDGNGYIDDRQGYDFCSYGKERDADPMDDYGHGTHCAGIAAAATDNSMGIAGVSWGCTIMPIKALSSFGGGLIEDLATAITYAVDNDASIISMSWGGLSPSYLLEDTLEYAYQNNVILVAAAGNFNLSSEFYPAAYDQVISVAATDHNDHKASFSNYGPWVDVAAPGVDILSTFFDNDYVEFSGTSMACPHVSGIVALLCSYNESLTNDMIMTIIRSAVDDIASPLDIGRGRINTHTALQRKAALAVLDSFQDWTDVKGAVDIIGKAWGESFESYIIEYGAGRNPTTWVELIHSTSAVEDGVLATLDTTTLGEGLYSIRLIVECIDGLYDTLQLFVVNNEFNLLTVDDEGSADYTEIHNAVDTAGKGDSIFIYNGIYCQELEYLLNPIIIDRSITITGESTSDTIIRTGIYITADDVQFSHVTVNPLGYGVILLDSKNCIVSHINCSTYIYLGYCNNNTIINNKATSGFLSPALSLYHSYNNLISQNDLSEGYLGIEITAGGNNEIIDNSIEDFYYPGIYLLSSGNLLRSNSLVNCGLFVDGVYLLLYENDIDTSNTVNGKPIYYYLNEQGLSVPLDAGQVYLINCSNSHVADLSLNSSYIGINLAFSTNIRIANNSISNCFKGINLIFSNTSNTITGNTITNTYYGITLLSCLNNIIANNTLDTLSVSSIYINGGNNDLCDNIASNSPWGIYALYSDDCRLANNSVSDSVHGIALLLSNNCTLNNNQLSNSSYLIRSGDDVFYEFNSSHFWHNIDASNTVNGKQLYYLLNETDLSFMSDAGQVIFVNCSTCIISNLAIERCSYAVDLIASEYNTIKTCELSSISLERSNHNTLQNNRVNNGTYFGISLVLSCDNIIEENNFSYGKSSTYGNYRCISLSMESNNNTIIKNGIRNIEGSVRSYGLWASVTPAIGISLIGDCCNNNIYENYIVANPFTYGFYITDGQSNKFINNTIRDNYYGLRSYYGAINNVFYHNNFFANTEYNAIDYGINVWDNGYPSGGNYWSDYRGQDHDGDGIGDIPHNITGGYNQDRYPLGYFDDESPHVEIIKPMRRRLYVQNGEIRPRLFRSLIFGSLEISVNASDNIRIDKVEIYIDLELRAVIQDQPFTWFWNEPVVGRHRITVKAYDLAGNTAIDTLVVRAFMRRGTSEDYGTIEGTVGGQGQRTLSWRIGGVTIEAENIATGDFYYSKTGRGVFGKGSYSLSLPPGLYFVTASKTGYMSQMQNVIVFSGGTYEVDFDLELVSKLFS